MSTVPVVPEPVRAKAVLAGAQYWLDGLPTLLAELCRDWSITTGRHYPDGTEAYVADATCADGTPAVLKLLVPRPRDVGAGQYRAARDEATVLRLAGGDGCARLLRDDVSRGALLIERLGPSLHDLGLPIGRRHEILCDLARRVWRPAPGCGLPTGADRGRWLAGLIPATWEELGRPCSRLAVEHAMACAARRVAAHHDERAVVVHGDVHEWNALRVGEGVGGGGRTGEGSSSTGERFKLVDPDGLLAEPEYDLGVMMREDPVELMSGDPYDRARWLAARAGLDATAVWEWGVVERVSTGLACASIGLQPIGGQMLAVADRIAARYS